MVPDGDPRMSMVSRREAPREGKRAGRLLRMDAAGLEDSVSLSAATVFVSVKTVLVE